MGIRIGRREALQWVAAGVGLCFPVRGQALSGISGRTTEWAFTTGKQYADPFTEIELDVVFRARSGNQELTVPAFWSNDNMWRVRFAPPVAGQYSWESVCSDRSNRELHGMKGTLDAAAYTGSNPLYRFGGVRVSPDRRHFSHTDGTPFFWLGDTWWMGLTRRMRWPDDFQSLAADRVRKGFTVVQIVAGLYPDMPWYDDRGANEAGYPWTKDFERINPSYFDQADVRIRYLVEQGIMPCIVGAWGYYLPLLGVTKMRQHWRNLVARWGSLPVSWCLAGEGTMPYYLSKQPKEDAATQKQGWTEIARYVRSIDAYRRMITIHPSSSGRDTVEDDRVLDFDMLQTGHGDRESIPNTIRKVTGSLARTPAMPVINGEVCYEGILEASRQEVQRFMFWSCVLCGAAGHTYGANGIWQVNTRERPYGASPHGRTWGNVPWDEAPLRRSRWVVYAKAPFGGPQHVIEYLGRYTHRVAISNRRLLALDNGQVSFAWKDYRDAGKDKVMTLSAEDFIHRFLQHALPPGFQRIRYYGFLANCHRARKLLLCRQLLATLCSVLLPSLSDCQALLQALALPDGRRCPQCGIGILARIPFPPPRLDSS